MVKNAKTKGAVRGTASSSSASSKVGSSGFVGFKTLQTSVITDSDVTSNLSQEMKLVLKKVLKKDAVTRLKALNSLIEQIQKDKSIWENILAGWPDIFNKIAVDIDRGVRLAAYKVHMILIEQSGKKFATIFKKVAANWICGRFDTSSDVVALALKSFEMAFPPSKRANAINFSRKEIINHIAEVVFVPVPHNIKTDIDVENQYCREISGVIRGLGVVVSNVDIGDDVTISGILDNEKFWKYIKSSYPQIRYAVYEFVNICLESSKQVIIESRLNICSSPILLSLNESEGSNIAIMWKCLVLFSKQFPSAWSYVNFRKGFTPLLRTAVSKCSQANIGVTLPSLLPLLSFLPSEHGLAVDFGLDLLKTVCSASKNVGVQKHFLCIVNTYTELLQYFLFKLQDNDNDCERLLLNLNDQVVLVFTNDHTSNSVLCDMWLKTFANIIFWISENDNALQTQAGRTCELLGRRIYEINDDNINKKTIMKSLVLKLGENYKGNNENYKANVSQFASSIVEKMDFDNIDDVNLLASILKGFKCNENILLVILNFHFKNETCNAADVYLKFCELFVFDKLKTPEENGIGLSIQLASLLSVLLTFASENRLEIIWKKTINTLTNENKAKFTLADDEFCAGFLEMVFKELKVNQKLNVLPFSPALSCFIIDYLPILNKFKNGARNCEPQFEDFNSNVRNIIACSFGNKLISEETNNRVINNNLSILVKGLTGSAVIHAGFIDFCINCIDNYIMVQKSLKTNIVGIIAVLLFLTSFPEYKIYNSKVITMFSGMCCILKNDSVLQELFLKICSCLAVQIASNNNNSVEQVITSVKIAYENLKSTGAILKPDVFINNLNAWSTIIQTLPTIHSFRYVLNGYEMTYEQLTPKKDDVQLLFSFTLYSVEILKMNLDQYEVLYADDCSQSYATLIASLLKIYSYTTKYCSSAISKGKPAIFEKIKKIDITCGNVIAYLQTKMTTNLFNSIFHSLFKNKTVLSAEGMVKLISFFPQNMNKIVLENLRDCNDLPFVSLLCDCLNNKFIDYDNDNDNDINVDDDDDDSDNSDNDIKVNKKEDGSKSVNYFEYVLYTIRNKQLTAFRKLFEGLSEEKYKTIWFSREKDVVVFLSTVNSCLMGNDHNSITNALCMFDDFYVHFFSDHLSSLRIRNQDSSCLKLQIQFARTLLYMSKYCNIFSFKTRLKRILQICKEFLLLGNVSIDLIEANVLCFLTVRILTNLISTFHKLKQQQIQGKTTRTKTSAYYIEDEEEEEMDVDMSIALTSVLTDWTENLSELCKMVIDILVNVDKSISIPWYTRELNSSVQKWIKILIRIGHPELYMDDFDASVKNVGSLLFLDHLRTQTAGYLLLCPLVEKEASRISKLSEENDEIHDADATLVVEEEETEPRVPPQSLLDLINSINADTHTHGYFLSWLMLLSYLQSVKSHSLFSDFISYLKKENAFTRILDKIFEVIFQHRFSNHKNVLPNIASEQFHVHVELASEIDVLAAALYQQLLSYLPAVCRAWFTACDKKLKGKIESYTIQHIAPSLLNHELDLIIARSTTLNAKTSRRARQVTTTYTLDDVTLELQIQIPTNYPLSGVSVDCGAAKQQKTEQQMIRQMSTFLAFSNSPLVEAIALWKESNDKRYEGVEECVICYSVIHVDNHSMPKLQCRTCKHKFHNRCLYKWFQSSAQSLCPLCRSPQNIS